MNPELKIRRHGYHLMSLASIGTVTVTAVGLCFVLLVLSGSTAPFGTWVLFDLPLEAAAGLDAGDRGLLAVAIVLSTLTYLLPLAAVRRVGKALHACVALSEPVASAFMRLAHSLPLSPRFGRGGAFVAAWVPTSDGAWQLRFTVSPSPSYFLLACLCIYSVAHPLRLAVQAAEDARGIV